MVTLQLGFSRFLLPSARSLCRFTSIKTLQSVPSYSCIIPSLPLKLYPNVKCFSNCFVKYQEVRDTEKQNTLTTKKKPQRKRRTVLEDDLQNSSNPVTHFDIHLQNVIL